MELYGQDPELRLLGALVTRLERRTMMDVGAEQGALATGMLEAGVERLYAFEPHPGNLDALRVRFTGDDRVSIHDYAISDSDGSGVLRLSSTPAGDSLPYGHTLQSPANTSEIRWAESMGVRRRSLQSLIDAGEIPASVGVLKIDTEGHDLAVVNGMGALDADIVMVEHWSDLPDGLGPCPWTTLDMVEALRGRGFSHFAFIVHRGDFTTMKWDDGDVETGAMGNLVFVHDRVLPRVLPDLLECAGRFAEDAVSVGRRYMRAARDRLVIIEGLENAAGDRLAIIEGLKEAANDRLALVRELDAVAEARLQALNSVTAQLNERNAELDELRVEHLDQR